MSDEPLTNCKSTGWVTHAKLPNQEEGEEANMRSISKSQFDTLCKCGLIWRVKDCGVSVLDCVSTLAAGYTPVVFISRSGMDYLSKFFKRLQWNVTLMYKEEGRRHIMQL